MADSVLTDPLVIGLPDAGLGNTAYLVDLGDGRALAVDASRDLRALEKAAAARGLQVAFAADTHLHADFLSGAVQLHADRGAEILASRAGGRAFPHRGLEDGEEVDLGGLTLRALATPGHTDEHLALVLLDGARELGVFSGGSLISGSAARVDLVSPDRTLELAAAQYRSVHRLAALPREARLWPTHGGGSFCSSAASTTGASTIGAELDGNPLLAAADEEAFVRMLVDTLGSFPSYFRRLPEINRLGPEVLSGPPPLRPLTPEAVAALVGDGAVVVDVRPVRSFARAHPVGALSIPLRAAFASWLGWLVSADRPVVVLRDRDQDADELVWQAAKIGYDDLVGEIAGGIGAWQDAGLPVRSLPVIAAADVGDDMRVLDVRQRSEYAAGHVPGAVNIELGSLATRLADLDDRPTVVMCGHSERAAGGASILAAAGFTAVRVLDGGPADLAATQGRPLETAS